MVVTEIVNGTRGSTLKLYYVADYNDPDIKRELTDGLLLPPREDGHLSSYQYTFRESDTDGFVEVYYKGGTRASKNVRSNLTFNYPLMRVNSKLIVRDFVEPGRRSRSSEKIFIVEEVARSSTVKTGLIITFLMKVYEVLCSFLSLVSGRFRRDRAALSPRPANQGSEITNEGGNQDTDAGNQATNGGNQATNGETRLEDASTQAMIGNRPDSGGDCLSIMVRE